MKPVVIAGYARSPFTPAFKGELARVRPDELASQVVRQLVLQTRINAEKIEDLIVGFVQKQFLLVGIRLKRLLLR